MFEKQIQQERKRKRRISLCILAVATIAICYILLRVIFDLSIVEGDSMSPGITEGNIAISNRLEKSFEEGDIVTVNIDGNSVIKRIGYIEDQKVYLIGDNAENSIDSRTFGMIDETQITGKVICVIRFF